MPIVTIQMKSDAVIPLALPGVLVEFYNLAGVFQTSGTTDVLGEATVTLPAASYDIYMYKAGISILPSQPQRIIVLTQVPPNVFKVFAHERVLPESTDPLKCRVSGHFVNLHGKPQKGVKVTIGPCVELADIGGNLVDPDHQVMVTSDDAGYVEFDILRGLKYEAFILCKEEWQGMPPGRLVITAPESPSVRLDYLLFPIPESVDFSALTLSLAAGTQNSALTLVVTYTDGNVRQSPLQWGSYLLVNSDATVFGYEVAGDTLIIKGLAPGVATLTATRVLAKTSVWNPLPPFNADILTVTVT